MHNYKGKNQLFSVHVQEITNIFEADYATALNVVVLALLEFTL